VTAPPAATPAPGLVEVRREVVPRWPVRLAVAGGMDGIARRRGRLVERLLHVEEVPVVTRVAQRGRTVHLGAWAPRRDAAEEAIGRTAFALGLDDDLRPFHERFRFDPLIGPSVRARPWLRVRRRPEPFEALAWAITEQLIDYPRAAAIQRAIVRAAGRRCPRTGLRDAPSPAALAGMAPALLESLGLAGSRAIALRRAAAEVAARRVDLRAGDHECGWARLRAIPGIGAWTVEVLALHGQGRHDQIPAGDLGFLRLVGGLRSGGDPRARASEEEVRELFAPYGEWRGLAGAHALTLPPRAGTRWSAPALRAAAA
jgi:3-methyladenine DNA glycosylase/8-oxoguanine DNA glycosylase